jgi:predicted chitinase
VDDIMHIYRSKVNRKDAEKNWPIVAKSMVKAGMTSKRQVVGFLSNVMAECNMRNIKEQGGPFRYDPFRGRGFIQLTNDDGYRAAGKHFKLDLVANPDLILQNTELSADIACWYWCGGMGNADIRPYAERGDWANCRSIINAGHPGRIGSTTQPGTREILEFCEKADAYFKSGLDPNAVGAAAMPSNYGLGCVDTGGAATRTLNGTGATAPLDALSYALGIHALDNQRSHILRCELDVSSQPDILKLDAQMTFEGKGFGEDLDGSYTVDEVTFYFGRTLEADLVAYKPDPNAPKPQIFGVGDAGQIAAGQQAQAAGTTPAAGSAPAAGDINQRILKAALAAEFKDTSAGPEGGNQACAWAVNLFAIEPAGLKKVGSNWVYCPSMIEAFQKGRGKKVSRAEAQPGDIWFAPNEAHVGVCLTSGCSEVLSNSSSKAKFKWRGSLDSMNRYYGGGTEFLYRVLN